MKATLRLGRIAGLEIGIHYTWLVALAFITWSLAEGFFPEGFPGWATATYWATGFLAALLLFASVLLHELANSFVARAKRVPVQGITLFIFGGVSNLQGEPRKARDEFAIAVVGPLTSLLLAGLCAGLALLASGQGGPLEATLAYLALVNALLKRDVPTVAVALRMPYDLLAYPTAPTYVCVYSIQSPAMEALARALFGHIPFAGRLPVSIPSR